MKKLDRHAITQYLLGLPRPFTCALSGNLGAGKTTLVRDVFFALGVEANVKSPSFSLLEVYDEINFLHIDLYRLELASKQDLLSMGFYDYENYSLFLEWPERLVNTAIKFDYKIDILLQGSKRIYCLN